MATAVTQTKDDGLMTQGDGNGNGETWTDSGDIKKYNIKGVIVYHREKKEGMKDYTMFLT